MTFQFHYGTIKRKHDVIGAALTANFNSTMVRLKASIQIQTLVKA